jgi:bifunctional non-homologous end joining protein LigD
VGDVLRDAGLVPFVKSSGSKGLHVVAPLDGSAHRDAVGDFADAMAGVLVRAEPERLTSEFRKAKREGRVLVDVARNRPSQTVVAPYSLRALPGAPVSAPLDWDELDPDSFEPRAHTLRSLPARIEEVGDLWASLGEHARPLPDVPAV